jgi:DNA-binding HxlR family transcriptional regulator
MRGSLHPSKILILRVLKERRELTSAQISADMPGLTVRAIHAALTLLYVWGYVDKRTIKESSIPHLIYWRLK